MILEEIKNRRSIRNYLAKEIPEEVLTEVLEAARWAPSASNRQPWKFVIIKDKELRQQIKQAAGGQSFVGEAPVVIAGCATNVNHIMPNGVHSYPVDLAIALDHLSLQAVRAGLGTCWVGAFNQDRVREILRIPKKVIVVCLMTIGYPASTGLKSSRKPKEDIICYNYYEE